MEQAGAASLGEGYDPAHADEGNYAEPSGAPASAQGGPPQGYGGAYGGGADGYGYGGQPGMNPMYQMDQMMYGGQGGPQGGPDQQQMYYQQQMMMGGHGGHGSHGGHGGLGGGGGSGLHCAEPPLAPMGPTVDSEERPETEPPCRSSNSRCHGGARLASPLA